MEFNVAQLLKLPMGTTRTCEVDERIEGIDESDTVTEVRGDVKLLRTEEGILVQATLETAAACTCVRCLEATRCELHLQVEEEFFPTIDVNTGYPVDVPEDSIGFTISANHILNLDEAIRQYMLIAQPMRPLCKPDCAGLCPQCGANLNSERCDCHLTAASNPFEDLAKLLDTEDPAASDERS